MQVRLDEEHDPAQHASTQHQALRVNETPDTAPKQTAFYTYDDDDIYWH
jgi:hypothetical protein